MKFKKLLILEFHCKNLNSESEFPSLYSVKNFTANFKNIDIISFLNAYSAENVNVQKEILQNASFVFAVKNLRYFEKLDKAF